VKHPSIFLIPAIVALLSPLLLADTANKPSAATPANTSSITAPATDPDDLTPAQKLHQWAIAPSYSYSFFDNGQQGWQDQDTQLYYQLNKKWNLGLELDYRDRPPTGSDILYSGFFSYTPTDKFELHGKITGCFDPAFSANEAYSIGFQYQSTRMLAPMLDFRGWNFNGQPINQVQPGVLITIDDSSTLAIKYAHGWAFDTFQYNYYIAIYNYEFKSRQRLTIAFDYGVDPDVEVGYGSTSVLTLSPAYTGTIFFRQPLGQDVDLYTGFEYDYRLNKSGGKLYQQYTPTLGMDWKF